MLFIPSAMVLMSSSSSRILSTYDVYYKHPVPSVPLSNEGKHSEPSVYDYNRVVKWEGLYRAAKVTVCY